MQHADHFRFDVGDPVERIHQQPARSLVQRQGHRVNREIAAAKILNDRGRSHLRRLARLVVALRAGHRNFGANSARQRQQHAPRLAVGVTHHRSRPLQIFLQLERVALNREIQIADGKTGNDVADGAAGQIQVHPRRLGGV